MDIKKQYQIMFYLSIAKYIIKKHHIIPIQKSKLKKMDKNLKGNYNNMNKTEILISELK